MSKKQPTLPTFGALVPGAGGRLAGIMRGNMVGTMRQPDYALIVADMDDVPLQWGAYGTDVMGANSLTDGVINTLAMIAAKCPAALHVKKMKLGGFKDWYLPARAEMWAARANVPELFSKNWHWTSTQGSSYYAFVQGFEGGYSYWDSKGSERRVRAFRRIPLQHFPT